MTQILQLDNPIRHYSWGSSTVIAELQGRPTPSSRPEAELWMGAHPSAPSRVLTAEGAQRLDEFIAQSPCEVLGAATAERFGHALPFLFKLLAIEQPLSLQTHPNLEQARVGFERENDAHPAIDDERRSYPDANHKPELVCAYRPLTVLYGFRPSAQTLELAGAIDSRRIRHLLQPLANEKPDQVRRDLLSILLDLSTDEASSFVAEVARSCPQDDDPAFRWVHRLIGRFQRDPLVIAPLLFNLVELEPGQALYTAPGVLHAYLGGTAIEVMTNSDNVVRAGLTDKPVDPQELLSIASYETSDARPLSPESTFRDGVRQQRYGCPADEFELLRAEIDEGAELEVVEHREAGIWLCVDGRATLLHGDGGSSRRLSIEPGQAAFVPADSSYRVVGPSTLFGATVPNGGGS